MTRIYTAGLIARPPEQVFDYVTTPAHWPEWHPSSLSVSGATDHPLRLGEEVVEEFVLAGRRGRVMWRVQTCNPPRHWVITGQVEGRGSGGTISYTLSPRDTGTFFEREFTYPTPGLVFTLLDRLVLRRQITAESRVAVAHLKQALEQVS